MANVFINGLKSKTGGGKSILTNYLTLLQKNIRNNRYFVLTPEKEDYLKYSCDYIDIVDISFVYKKNICFPILYKFAIPKLLQQYNIDLIFNLGDVIIPTSIPQLYLFDWAYAVYPESIVWDRMNLKDLLTRKIKTIVIKRYIYNAAIVISQTKTIKDRLVSTFKLNNVEIVPNAVTLENLSSQRNYDFGLPKNKIKLLYLSNYSSHKNIEILIPIAKKIKVLNLPYHLIVTFERRQHKLAGKFMENIENFGLQEVLQNIGNVQMDQVPSLYEQCDALIMPTLLETYGLPYIEAMYHGKTILTSDLDFAKDVCGEAAFYFDPLDDDSILASINLAFRDENLRIKKTKVGKSKIAQLPSWNEVFMRYHDLLEMCNSKKS